MKTPLQDSSWTPTIVHDEIIITPQARQPRAPRVRHVNTTDDLLLAVFIAFALATGIVIAWLFL